MKKFIALLLFVSFVFVSCSNDSSNPVISVDSEAPSAVTDLSVGFTSGNSATLFLTATGDDGIFGRAKTYEVRYATSMIDSANYALATQFLPPNQPNVGTADDTIIVTGLLPNTKYYFAVKLADETPNWSPISNIDSATTLLSGSWTVYRTDNSDLPSNEVLAIQLDGVVKYISTLDGVSTYNNTTWNLIYDAQEIRIDTTIIVSDTTIDTTFFGTVNSIAIESSSQIWFGTNSNGVALLEGDSTVFYKSNDSGISILSLTDILISDNKLWIGTLTSGLYSFALDGSNVWQKYDVPITLHGLGKINCIEATANNEIWTGLQVYGASVLGNSVFTNYSSDNNFTNKGVWDISDSGTKTLFGTDAGAFLFENDIWTNYMAVDSGLPDNVVTAVVIDNQGTYWFGTRFGLASFNGTVWTNYTTVNSYLPDNFINTLQVDMFGNLWIGTKNGLARFSN